MLVEARLQRLVVIASGEATMPAVIGVILLDQFSRLQFPCDLGVHGPLLA